MEKSCLEAINDRRSIVEFTDEEVSKESLDQILTAALRASGPGGALFEHNPAIKKQGQI